MTTPHRQNDRLFDIPGTHLRIKTPPDIKRLISTSVLDTRHQSVSINFVPERFPKPTIFETIFETFEQRSFELQTAFLSITCNLTLKGRQDDTISYSYGIHQRQRSKIPQEHQGTGNAVNETPTQAQSISI